MQRVAGSLRRASVTIGNGAADLRVLSGGSMPVVPLEYEAPTARPLLRHAPHGSSTVLVESCAASRAGRSVS